MNNTLMKFTVLYNIVSLPVYVSYGLLGGIALTLNFIDKSMYNILIGPSTPIPLPRVLSHVNVNDITDNAVNDKDIIVRLVKFMNNLEIIANAFAMKAEVENNITKCSSEEKSI
jgi:hypothetical protein